MTRSEAAVPQLWRLRDFVFALTALVDRKLDDRAIQREGAALLERLISHDDWLPHAFAQANPEHYRQYLLYCDPQRRFSVSSFVWGPGQTTPIHDHTVWGMVGVLRGAERVECFGRDDAGRLSAIGVVATLHSGDVDVFGPAVGDIHRVSNAHHDRASVSIHVYGGDIATVHGPSTAWTAAPAAFGRPTPTTALPTCQTRLERGISASCPPVAHSG